jgi:3-hydroxy-9,10-secoandrosta-1,3,5(10)-triene-9,17-dione monooxygenase reductase component
MDVRRHDVNQRVLDSTTFRQALSHYPTGVCAITALMPAGKPTGMVVGTFTAVSLDPFLVGFLPDRKSWTWSHIQVAGHFCVNVLASDQTDVCQQLAAKGEEKFAGIDYALSKHNLPIITNSLANIECELYSVCDAGDHAFVLGRVLDLEVTRDADPLLFLRGCYGGFAALQEADRP